MYITISCVQVFVCDWEHNVCGFYNYFITGSNEIQCESGYSGKNQSGLTLQRKTGCIESSEIWKI